MRIKNSLMAAGLVAGIIIGGSSLCYGQQNKNDSQTYTGEKTKKPNIIFIITDDQGWGDFGLFYQNKRKKEGKPYERTPNLDKLARHGAQLRAHYASAPICMASRVSLMRGVSQGLARDRNNQFDRALEDNWTIASVLKKLGYATAIFGKWGMQGNYEFGDSNGANWPANPLNRGFDYFLGYMRHVDGHEHYPKEGIDNGRKQVWLNHKNITPKLDKCYTADLWTAGAKHWIQKHEQGKNADKPFFMYLAYETPHAAFELPTQAYPSGGGLHGGLQWTGRAHHMINTASGKIDSYVYPAYVHAKYDSSGQQVPWPDVYQRWATSIHRIDNGVGDLMQLLKDLHIAKNTLVVFTSDNGPTRKGYFNHLRRKVHHGSIVDPTFFRSYGPFDGNKRDTWEGGLREPTLAVWPGHIPAGQVIKSPSIQYDWLATFTAAAGVPAPEVSDGVSLLPELTGKGKQEEPLIYVEYYQGGHTPNYKDFAPAHRGRKRGQMQMIRMGDYVGVRYNIQSQSDPFEIYNVTEDPQETKNLANTAKYPESADLASSLQQKMKAKVLRVRRPNKSAPRPYDDVLVPPVKNKETTQGITWKLYKGKFPWVPHVFHLEPSKTGEASKPALSMVDANANEVVVYEGYLKIPEDGNYTFYLKTDTGAELRIYDATVIDEDYGYWGGVWKQGSIKLKAGLHPFHLFYRRDSTKLVAPSLHFGWSGPGIKRQRMPIHVFNH